MGFTTSPFDPIADAKARAAKIRSLNQRIMDVLGLLDGAYDQFWGSANPQGVGDELGPDGPPMAFVHAALTAIRVQVLLHDGKIALLGNIKGLSLTKDTDPKLPASYTSGPPKGFAIDQAASAAQDKLVIIRS